jgi:hypothetical protein
MKKVLIYFSVILFLGMAFSFNSCKKDPEADAVITGFIIDSQTGLGLANADLYFTNDLTAADYDNADYSTTTGTDGSFTITVVAGDYKCFVVYDGFFIRVITGITAITGNNALDAVTLVSAPNTGSYRIVLTWGVTPDDLDSHLTGPDGSGGRFHMYYSDKNPNQYVSLDVDDLVSYGPETTTITSFYTGTYRYSVHNYSNRYTATGGSGIVSSPTKVELYDHTGLLRSFSPPTFTGTGDTWRVFEIVIVGTAATINTINTFILTNSSDNIDYFKSNNQKEPYLDSKYF